MADSHGEAPVKWD